MKTYTLLFLLVSNLMAHSQLANPTRFEKLKQEILESKEVRDWQNAMISFQKSNAKLCALIYEEKLHRNVFAICGTQAIEYSFEKYILQLFRTMRITEDLRDAVEFKEKVLRTKYPELATHFAVSELFQELYAPIQEAREN